MRRVEEDEEQEIGYGVWREETVIIVVVLCCCFCFKSGVDG